MFSLLLNWELINYEKNQELGIHNEAVAQNLMRAWNSDLVNINMLLKAIELLKPVITIELGTFEALTTIQIAQKMSEYSNEQLQSTLWTFDATGPVSVYGDGKTDIENWEQDEIWSSWTKVRETRAQRLNAKFKGVNIRFIEGLIQDTLPVTIDKIGTWNLCYQDSVHGFDLILSEWNILKDFSKPGSLIIFDDITINHPFKGWFFNHNLDWAAIWTPKGRSQLWAQRIK